MALAYSHISEGPATKKLKQGVSNGRGYIGNICYQQDLRIYGFTDLRIYGFTNLRIYGFFLSHSDDILYCDWDICVICVICVT